MKVGVGSTKVQLKAFRSKHISVVCDTTETTYVFLHDPGSGPGGRWFKSIRGCMTLKLFNGIAPPGDFLAMSTKKEMAMKKSRIGSLLASISLVSATFLQAQQSDAAIEKAVAALEQKWLQSQKTSNPDLLAPLLADRFVNTGNDGTVTGKAEALALIKTMKFERAEYYDVKVTVFGNTAIATGGFKGQGTDATGKPLNVNERWTDTWVKMPNGQWQCVASHASPISS